MLQGCVRLSVVCDDVCIVTKRCVLEQKLNWQPVVSRMWGIDCYQNEWPWPLFRGRLRSCQPWTIASHSPLNISETVSDRPRGMVVWFQRTINRIWPAVTVGSRRCGLSKCLTNCASYGKLSGHCLKMRVKHWYRRSSPVAWTTATLCFRLNRLQSVQNAAARLVSGTRRSDT